jgi:hypothetical protein
LALLLAGVVSGAGNEEGWRRFELLQARRNANIARIPALELRYQFSVDEALPGQSGGMVRTWQDREYLAFESLRGRPYALMRWDVQQWRWDMDSWSRGEDSGRSEGRLQFGRTRDMAWQRLEEVGRSPSYQYVELSWRETGKRLLIGTLPWEWCDPYAGVCTYWRNGGLELVSFDQTEEEGEVRSIVVFRHGEEGNRSTATFVCSEAQGCLPIRVVRTWSNGDENVFEAENRRFPLKDGSFFFPMRVVSRCTKDGRLSSTMTYEVVPDSIRVHQGSFDPSLFELQDKPDAPLLVGETGWPLPGLDVTIVCPDPDVPVRPAAPAMPIAPVAELAGPAVPASGEAVGNCPRGNCVPTAAGEESDLADAPTGETEPPSPVGRVQRGRLWVAIPVTALALVALAWPAVSRRLRR